MVAYRNLPVTVEPRNEIIKEFPRNKWVFLRSNLEIYANYTKLVDLGSQADVRLRVKNLKCRFNWNSFDVVVEQL